MKNIDEIISGMTLEEKAELLTGFQALTTKSNDRFGIKAISLSDGPHGVRRLINHPKFPQECNIDGGDVCFPSGSALGASWNPAIAFETGAGIARDCHKEDVQVILAPAVNMKRTIHCGRNFEYFSEDPYLSAIVGAGLINGVQSEGVGTSLKHYAANNQEINRGTINAEIDERTLREYYLRVFEILLKHCDPTSVMCAYNKINGIWCSENRYLLTELLKEEWGYNGLVVSDWGAVHNISKAIKAGLDLQMPQNANITEQIKSGLETGIIDMSDVDRALRAMLKFLERIEKMQSEIKPYTYSREEQHEVAYRAACETITLLRNENSILPITPEKYKKVAVLGYCAEKMLFMGSGSSKVSIEDGSEENPLECIKSNADGIQIDYYPSFCEGYQGEPGIRPISMLNPDYDCVLIFVGNCNGMDSEGEGYDRDNVKFPNYVNVFIEKAMAKFPNTVVIMQTGSAIIPDRWDKVPALVQMWYSGEAGGRAIADVLFGKVNPSGKLSETFMLTERQGIQYPGDGTKCEYLEKFESGYRYYDKHPEEVWFPFGHGLSYTNFEYSDIKIDCKTFDSDKFKFSASCKIKNVGECSGKEVVQLYVAPLDSVVARPIKELKGFEKIHLDPGEEKTVTFTIRDEDLAYYNTCLHGWHVESGCFEICIGASSADIKLRDRIFVRYDEDYTKEQFDNSMIVQ